MKVSKSVALLESAPPAVDDYYRATSIVSLVEYSVGPDDVPAAEKVRCTCCGVVNTKCSSF